MAMLIGLDGGGSKTKCVLCNGSLDILYSTTSGPSNFLTAGIDTVTQTITELIIECCTNQNIDVTEIDRIVLGTTGAGRESDALKLEESVLNAFEAQKIHLKDFLVVSDARIALEGAFKGGSGSILIAGTGSIMFGKSEDGKIYRVGGFGRIIGDEGSGLTIGRKGLGILGKYFDGRIKETLLKEKIEKQFEISNQEQLINKVYSDFVQPQLIAPLLMEAAAEGDKYCQEILDKESDELLMHIMAMQEKLGDDNMKLAFIGGIVSNNNPYSNMLKEKIKLYLPHIKLQNPDYPPEIGAVIMAKQTL